MKRGSAWPGISFRAHSNCTAAVEEYEGYLSAIQGLASLTIRAGREDERLAGWLQEIAMRAEDAEWRA